MSPRAKESLSLGFRSLLSNAACVELGRTRPWYSAIIVVLLSLVISLIPAFTSYMTVSGGSLVSSPTYGFETGLYHFQEDSSDIELASYLEDSDVVVTDGSIALTREKWVAFTNAHNAKIGLENEDGWNWYRHLNTASGLVDFQVFFTELTDSEFTNYAKTIAEAAGSTTPTIPDYENNGTAISSNQGIVIYAVNTIILGKNEFRILKYNSAGTLAAGGYGVKLLYTDNLPLFANELPDSSSENYATELDEYLEANISSWASYCDAAYRDYKNLVAWSQVGIMAAIFAGFILLMGLLVFILTRGRNNPFKIINIWEAQKIVYWSALTPALLQLILGFLMGSTSIMAYAFVFLIGMRVMWLSMRTLGPNQQA